MLVYYYKHWVKHSWFVLWIFCFLGDLESNILLFLFLIQVYSYNLVEEECFLVYGSFQVRICFFRYWIGMVIVYFLYFLSNLWFFIDWVNWDLVFMSVVYSSVLFMVLYHKLQEEVLFFMFSLCLIPLYLFYWLCVLKFWVFMVLLFLIFFSLVIVVLL